MSQFDDDYDNDDFDSPEDTDPIIRELRAEIVRLEAQLDQLAASIRERAAETAVIAAEVAELKVAVARLQARQRRDLRLALGAWLMVIASLTLTLYNYLAR